MKKEYFIGIIVCLIVAGMCLPSCSNLIEDLKEKKETSLYEMVDVINSSTTVTGTDPTFVSSNESNNYKGVFRSNRNVTLSPYSMGKYEVSQIRDSGSSLE